MKISEIKDHLKKFRVGIAGAGGLGSNCAAALARSGVGTLVIADFDIVEESNLSRQYYFLDQTGKPKTDALKENLSRISKEITIVIYQEKLNSMNIPVIFSGCDIIVEAFDKPDMKEMLIETVNDKMPGIPLIIGSGVAGWGGNNSVKCRKIDENLYVCGDETSESCEELPPVAPKVGIVANMQANMAIDLLLKRK